MTNKHMIITKVQRGFIVKYMHGKTQKEAAVYLDLAGDVFGMDVEEFFKDPTEAELKELEKKARTPVV